MTERERTALERQDEKLDRQGQRIEAVVDGLERVATNVSEYREEVHVLIARTDSRFEMIERLCNERHGQLGGLPERVSEARGAVSALKTVAPWLLAMASLAVSIAIAVVVNT